MARPRGRQQVLAVSVDDSPIAEPPERGPRDRFTKTIALWIPKRFLLPNGADLAPFLRDVNEKIASRSFVLWDGQLLTTTLTEFSDAQLIFEGDAKYDVPDAREWGTAQTEYFSLENPYQMAEDAGEYTCSHLMIRLAYPYLANNEFIMAVLHGERDGYFFYCTCHQADVAYTTRHRLVCMGCGAVHAVLRHPLEITPKRLLTPDEWAELFDEDGSCRDEEVELSILEFQDVETADMIWVTEQWEDAKHEFVFFSRSSPGEIEEAIRGTEADPSIFLEAGWTPVAASPPPAHQIANDSVDVDLLNNAALALQEGVSAYIGARNHSERLVTALPQLFRAVELLLKVRLEELNGAALKDHPNNPTVLERLAASGVAISSDELATVHRLRRLRNDLQHGTAKLNYRTGLSICRKTLVFIDRFVEEDLKRWIADVLNVDDWYALLAISSVSERAARIVSQRLDEIRQDPVAEIGTCPRCKQTALVRPHPKTGQSCIYCGHIPVYKYNG